MNRTKGKMDSQAQVAQFRSRVFPMLRQSEIHLQALSMIRRKEEERYGRMDGAHNPSVVTNTVRMTTRLSAGSGIGGSGCGEPRENQVHFETLDEVDDARCKSADTVNVRHDRGLRETANAYARVTTCNDGR